MMHWNDGFYGFNMGHPMGWLMMVIFWLFIIMGVLYLARNLRGPSPPDNETPLDIVKKRYASGDITKEEFEMYKKDIES